MSTLDDQLGEQAMLLTMEMTDKLRSAKKPLKHGDYMRFKSFIPLKAPDDIRGWDGYAQALRVFIGEFNRLAT